MGSLYIDQLKTKIESLSDEYQLQINDFIEYLMTKQKNDQHRVSSKDQLLKVSIWDDADLKYLEGVAEDFREWKIRTF
jgi:hypothetical protein